MNDCVEQFRKNQESGLLGSVGLSEMDEAIAKGDASEFVRATFNAVDEKKVVNILDAKATRLPGKKVID